MHDEYERAMTGRGRPGLGIWGWIGLTFAGFVLIGTAVSVTAFVVVKNKVEAFVEEQGGPEAAIARALASLDDFELVDPARGSTAVRLRNRGTEEAVTLDFQDLVEGSLRVVGPDGERVSIDLRGNESGGSLVIDADGERVTFDLVRDGGAASLVIRSSEGEEVHLGAGDRALDVPTWIPSVADRPDRPRHVFSARQESEWAGAVLWETDLTPEQVAEQVTAGLERSGLAIETSGRQNGTRRRTSMRLTDPAGDRGAFLVATRSDGRTLVFLGYREVR